MECPECDSDRIEENEKTGEVVCESCGYEIPEPKKSEFKKQLELGHREEKKKW